MSSSPNATTGITSGVMAYIYDKDTDLSEEADGIYYSSLDYDVYFVKDGNDVNWIQGDYPITKVELYKIPDGVDAPSTYAEIKSKCTLVQTLTKSDTEYTIAGSFNIIAVHVT